MAIEYQTSFFKVEYKTSKESGLFFSKGLPSIPLPESLMDNPIYKEHMLVMGDDNWDLVSVQPLLQGHYKYEEESYGLGYSIISGYYFFWKRQKPTA